MNQDRAVYFQELSSTTILFYHYALQVSISHKAYLFFYYYVFLGNPWPKIAIRSISFMEIEVDR